MSGYLPDVYQDNRPCDVCGSEVRLRAHEATEDPADATVHGDNDSTVDERVCTNPECPTNAGGADAPRP